MAIDIELDISPIYFYTHLTLSLLSIQPLKAMANFGGDGPLATIIDWILASLTLLFVILRVYTRIWLVHSYGFDDHAYIAAFILLVLYVSSMTVSASYGFGQNVDDIADPQQLSHAMLFEMIGQTFAVLGMAVAKWSLGLFLLRLVAKTWHKVAIWAAMVILMGASISVCFVFWLQCTPPSYIWDHRVIGGYCAVDATPVSMLLCILCVMVDFFFALFPWIFIWDLTMNRREKVVILISLSLGIFAGACGIKRTLEVTELSSANYLKDTVGLIVWSTAEIAVTMICIGIPTCRPMYKDFLDKLISGNASEYQRQEDEPSYALRTFGGSTLKTLTRPSNMETRDTQKPIECEYPSQVLGTTSRKIFIRSAGTALSKNSSDDGILGNESRNDLQRSQQDS
ncbi:hypothetical protein BX600DRAFT_497366 [Xylariales sp. PMI_506]|nr:hypothetical protein BX600DRAFT_497366 [Xylariales sp. PMI_506]